MNCTRQCVLSIILFMLIVAISCQFRVEATRLLQEDFASVGKGYHAKYSLYESSKYKMAYFLERLSSGPSDGGGGN